MIDLQKKLENNISYLNSWDYLSKSIIIANNLSDSKTILIVCDNEEDIIHYEKIFSFFYINVNKLETEDDMANLIFNKDKLFICKYSIFEEKIVDDNYLKNKTVNIKKWEIIDLNNLLEKLNNLWYSFSEHETKWSYKKLWDTLTIVSHNWNNIYKISLWWDSIESIEKSEIRWELKSDYTSLDEISFWANLGLSEIKKNISSKYLNDTLKHNNLVFTIFDHLDFKANIISLWTSLTHFCLLSYNPVRNLSNFDLQIGNTKIDNIDKLLESLKNEKFKQKIIYSKSKKTIENFVSYNNINNTKIIETKLNNFKSFQSENSIIICDDVLNEVFTKKRVKRSVSIDMDLLLKIKIWDYVVHIDHWIWIYKWVISKTLWDIKKEYIEIEYKANDKLFVPITEIWRVNKYVWESEPKLTWLNTNEWERKIKSAWEDVEKIATELLEIYSKRKISNWFKHVIDKEKNQVFKSEFPYIHTEDQIKAINEILEDMSISKPMDRLLIWDVWFWKTEVAFNAIYNSYLNKKQSLLLSPLVVLAYEHYEKALSRFAKFWLKIAVLTRLENSKKRDEVIKKISSWDIDLIVWTHSLLSEKIIYKDLWLMVIDEEHKFWAIDKEKIKKYKESIDILSMSATPIPRSLNMALSSIRDMTIIKTAPYWRQNINTYVSDFNTQTIYDSLKREFDRWGQVFFIHNRIQNIGNIEKIIKDLFPDKKIIITHWSLPWIELEKRIIDFKNRQYDLLLSTTVIENGIDFSNVNTIIINKAESFWLSTIHQLRWRVWRSDKKWYCILLYKKEKLEKHQVDKLKTIVEYSYLWAWYEIAMKDLEIRWWWDILWIKQSGHAIQIWVNLFLKMVEEKINALKYLSNNKIDKDKEDMDTVSTINTKIDLNIECFLEDDFFMSEMDKINFYREIECINNIKDIDNIILDFRNQNWELNKSANNFFDLLRLKIISWKYKIISIKRLWLNYQIDFDSSIWVEDLKRFLNLDKEVIFTVINVNRLRANSKKFNSNDALFLDYMLKLFSSSILSKKIKLKKKAQ